MSDPAATTPVLASLGARSSIRADVGEALREAMVSGAMEPGQVYSAPALARLLGVSATPVREAMIDLCDEGHVEAIRNRGYRVVPISDADLDEIAQLRALIEVPTVERVATLARPADVAPLRPLADELERSAAEGRLIDFMVADTAFHLGLLALAGNRRLVQEVRRLRAFSRLSSLRRLHEEGVLGQTAAEHGRLLDLVAAHDAPGAAALMDAHIGHVRGVWAGNAEA